MIRQSRGEYVAECDDCGAKAFGGVTESFLDFVQEIKDIGWRPERNGEGDWLHYCPECGGNS